MFLWHTVLLVGCSASFYVYVSDLGPIAFVGLRVFNFGLTFNNFCGCFLGTNGLREVTL